MTAFIHIINHLIHQNRETQAELALFAGKTLSLHAAGIEVCGTFDAEGFLKKGNADADTVITFRDSALLKILQGQTPGVGDVGIGGDTGLGMALLPLIGGLRYYANDDLSRLFGDALAGSVSTRAAAAGRTVRKIGLSIIEQLGDFALEPDAPVVHREVFEIWSQEVDALRDDAARLEARLEKLECKAVCGEDARK